MENRNTELSVFNGHTKVVGNSGLSEAIIIEIVHGIKEIIIEYIHRKYQPVPPCEER